MTDPNRRFPMQGTRGAPGGWIPWWLAEIVYAGYVARYGAGQSLERLAERGGFGFEEMGMLLSLSEDEPRHLPRSRKIVTALENAWRGH